MAFSERNQVMNTGVVETGVHAKECVRLRGKIVSEHSPKLPEGSTLGR
jgi:hypothetical protein